MLDLFIDCWYFIQNNTNKSIDISIGMIYNI